MPRLGSPIRKRDATPPPAVAGCRWIPLTKGMFALVDAADYNALSKFCWVYHWQGYAFRKAPVGVVPKQIRMHREIMGITDQSIEVDHRNGNGLDNRRQNLRVATHTQNNRNNSGRRQRGGPYKGVNPSGRKSKPWAARISVNGKTINLGRFATAEEAALVYDEAAQKHFGEFAKTNAEISKLRTLELVSGGRDALQASEEFFE